MPKGAETIDLDQPIGPGDKEIFLALTASQDAPEVVIPDDVDPSTLWDYLRVGSKLVARAQEAINRLKPMIGRMLVVLQKHPHLYEAYGYRNFDHFMTEGMPKLFGIHRSDAYNCLAVAKNLSFLPQDRMNTIGFTKLSFLAGAIKKTTQDGTPIEMRERNRNEWVNAAETMTLNELKGKMAVRGLIEPGEKDFDTIAMRVSKITKEEWEKFIVTPEIQAYCESDSAGDIFARMLAEVTNEWIARATDALRP
jgi:hypothetical protein